jgi:hypothetical protein
MGQSNRVIVVMAFDRANDGELELAFDAVRFDKEERALNAARNLAGQHVGILVLSWEAEPNIGSYGPSTVLFQSGEVPDTH